MLSERFQSGIAIVAAVGVVMSMAIIALLNFQSSASKCGWSDETRFVHFKVTDNGPASAVMASATPLFLRNPATLRAEAADGGPDLSRWYRIEIAEGHAEAFAARLANDAGVETAFVAPVPELATAREMGPPPVPTADDSCPIKTPSYEPYQGYLSMAPAGINAPAAWVRPGGRGENVWFADIEGGWNADHEDLPGDRMEHVAGAPIADRGWVAHGTAVVGEVAARDNGIGMVGIAPDVARIFTASIGDISPAAAIDAAAARLRPGDVLLIELHAIGPRGRFLPMEYWDDVYEAITVATRKGVIVIEAAGNGAENLDHRAYRGKLDRKKRDSGAIMVGAGAPARAGWTDRSRLDFSNYGSRVDVQGWGRHVATLDYGDLQNCAERRQRDYTDLFGGTSSASPIVAGAAILIQSVSVAERGVRLTPKEMRQRLIDTGSPQTDGPHGSARQHIGPRPDLARALRWD